MSFFNDTQSFFNDNSRTLAPKAVASQAALMSIVSVVTVLLFNLLRPKNKIIYEPKVKYHEGNKPPPRISDSLFGWLPPLVTTKEPELLDKIGLDAVAFLRFLRLMRWLFTAVSILCCGVLIPINVVFNLQNVPTAARDILSMLTIRDVRGSFLYAHVIVTYLITFVIIIMVDFHWKAMVRLRHTWFRSPEYLQSFYARTLQVRHVPKKYQTDEGLKAIFESVKVPYPTTSVHIGRKVGRLPELIEYHNQTVREFEEVLVKYLKGGKIRAKRPTIRIKATCGLGGQKMDAIDYYTAKLQATEKAIEDYRNEIDTRKAENYGFASMAAVPYAHIVAKILSGKSPKGSDITLAPNPKDIIWKNMNESSAALAHRRVLGIVWLCFVCFFNTVPLFVISILANLDTIKTYVPFLQAWSDSSPDSFAFVSGVLPPAVSGIFGWFLPIIMRWLTTYMGALTHSRLDRAVVQRYFAFLIISQLVIFTLIGVIFSSVQEIVQQIGQKASFKQIIDNLDKLPATIHRTYINQSSYWLTFFPLRGFLVVFDLAQIINLVWLSFKTHMFGRTPRDIRDWTKPPDFQYAIYYSNILFMGAVGLVFAPLAPLVVVAATVVFWMSSWVYKYQLMFVFVSKVESGGRIWNVVINRLLFCVLLMQLLMILTLGLQFRFISLQWLASVPPVLFVVLYKFYINRVYVPKFNYFSPTEEEIRLAKVYSERADHKADKLGKRFGHPALHAELFTPMLHKKMMPLLAQVYHGKISQDHAKLDEYGGQKMEAQIVPGGIKIAAIDQSELEYDPAMYQRDRGELDWDQRSLASTAVFDQGSTVHGHKGGAPSIFGGSNNKYDHYLAHGPGVDIEMAKLDNMEEPLLSPRSMALHQQGFASHQSLASGSYSTDTLVPSTHGHGNNPRNSSGNLLGNTSPHSQYPPSPQHARQNSGNLLNNNRTQSPGPYSMYPPTPSPVSPAPGQHGRQPSGNMLGAQPPYGGPQNNRAPSPQPPSSYAPHHQHSRTTSGNMLADPNLGRQSPGPYQAYGAGVQPQQHQRQMSGNILAGRTASPGPYQAYGGGVGAPPPPHQRQSSGNVLQQQQGPGGYYGRSGTPTLGGGPSPNQAYPPQQQHSRQGSGNMLNDYGNRRGY